MLKMSRLTDYCTVVLAHLDGNQSTYLSAAEIVRSSGIACQLPAVSKVLKMLVKAGLQRVNSPVPVISLVSLRINSERGS